MRVTIACPAALRDDANSFARCIGLGPEDDKTFGEAGWRDATGALYAVASGLVSETFQTTATSPLVEPPWGADLDAATSAQAVLHVGAAAAPGIIAAVIDDDPQAALAVLGVTRVEIEVLE